MRVSYREIAVRPAIDLINDLVGARGATLPFRTSRYLGTRVAKALQERWKEFDQERLALLEKFGEKQADGNSYVVANEKMPEYITEWNLLLDEIVELTNIDKIKIDDFEKANLTPSEWAAIDWLVTE